MLSFVVDIVFTPTEDVRRASLIIGTARQVPSSHLAPATPFGREETEVRRQATPLNNTTTVTSLERRSAAR
jgi:hypothetical protein